MKKIFIMFMLIGIVSYAQNGGSVVSKNGVDVKTKIGNNENFVYVEGGTFLMGGNNYGKSNEKPAHSVTLNSFYISKYEVTQKEWIEIMGDNPCIWEKDNFPVDNVSWNDIQDYIKKLNKKTKKKYRLPTEAEWEYAARGGNKSNKYTYSGSNDIHDVAWHYDNSRNRPHEVGTKMPNELGIFDMSGNVWEWCDDWYGENYYASSPSKNPKGPNEGECCVIRGGSWGDVPYSTTARTCDDPNFKSKNTGFRLVHD